MTPDEATLGRLAGFVAQAATTSKRKGRAPDRWHRALADDADLGFALARRDATHARNRVRCVVLKVWPKPGAVPEHVVAVLRYLGVVLHLPPRDAG